MNTSKPYSNMPMDNEIKDGLGTFIKKSNMPCNYSPQEIVGKIPLMSNISVIDGFNDDLYFRGNKTPAYTDCDGTAYQLSMLEAKNAYNIPDKPDFAKGLYLGAVAEESDNLTAQIAGANRMLRSWNNPLAAEYVLNRKLNAEQVLGKSVSSVDPTIQLMEMGKTFPMVKVDSNRDKRIEQILITQTIKQTATDDLFNEEEKISKIKPSIGSGKEEVVEEEPTEEASVSASSASASPPEYKGYTLEFLNNQSDNKLKSILNKTYEDLNQSNVIRELTGQTQPFTFIKSLIRSDEASFPENIKEDIRTSTGKDNLKRDTKIFLINYLGKKYPKFIKIEGQGLKKRKKTNKTMKSYIKPSKNKSKDNDFVMERLKTLLGSIEAGNKPNKLLFNELNNVIDYLLMNRVIDNKLAGKIIKTYMN